MDAVLFGVGIPWDAIPIGIPSYMLGCVPVYEMPFSLIRLVPGADERLANKRASFMFGMFACPAGIV